MKKICAILLALAMMLTLFACIPGSGTTQDPGGDTGDTNNQGNGNETPENPFGGEVTLPIIPAA